MNAEDYTVRKATSADLDAVKALADAHRNELGFVLRPALAKSIALGEVLIAENSASLIGFVEYHHRRDEQTTLYHIAVTPRHRRQGVGRALIDALRNEALTLEKRIVRLKCPVDLPAQGFYVRLGFSAFGQEMGKGRPLVVWTFPLAPPDEESPS